jgi:hypothetical protein
MADFSCDCNVTLGNSGVPGCQAIAAVTRKLIIVPTYADDGTKNRILKTDTLNQAFFDALVDNTDASKRYYPTVVLDNVEDVRADSIQETLNSGENTKIQDGIRSFSGFGQAVSTVYLSKIQNWACVDISAYAVDRQGNLIGKDSADGLAIEPISINQNTWDPQAIKATDTTKQKISHKFEWSSAESDGDLRQINSADLGGADLLSLSGLLDVTTVISAITATTFTATLTLDYGSYMANNPVKGWVVGDFSFDETSPSPGSVIISSVTEGVPADGVYAFVVPIMASPEIYALTASKAGFDFTSTVVTAP